MGVDFGGEKNRPAHPVDVAAFYLDATEVTVAAYAKCARSGGCTAAATSDDHPDSSDDGRGPLCNATVPGREDHPVNCVDFAQATAFCAWAGKRLPTEEEWEYAARGTDGRQYPWGNEPPAGQLCWNGDGNDRGKRKRNSTCPVGSHPDSRSAFGVDDMAGNVAEWTSSGDSRSYAHPREEAVRIMRGGSFEDYADRYVTAWMRDDYPAIRFYHYIGFRCAKTD